MQCCAQCCARCTSCAHALSHTVAASVTYGCSLRHLRLQVLCSVHQPRSNIYRAFHRLLLLSRGTAVYSGALPD